MQQNLRVLVWWCVALVLLGGCVAGELVGDSESSATEEDFLPQSRRDGHRHRPRDADASALTAPDAQANAADAGALRDPDAGASAADATASRPDARVSPDLGPVDEYGAGGCLQATGNPLGGGAGYTLGISRSDPRVKYIVDTASELLAALQSARSGEVIYIEGTANIDLSGRFSVGVPAGVTLASNRGENGAAGGRIFQSRLASDSVPNLYYPPLFRPAGAGVRFTGLRIEGPDKAIARTADQRTAILTYSRLEVDNCEIWGWSAGVAIYNTAGGTELRSGGHYHHNHLHNIQANGIGYGIVVNNGSAALIEANFFDACRHAIAGDGNAGNSYEVRYNRFGPNFPASNTAHVVDMHGASTASGCIAGDKLVIHHNTFEANSTTDYCISVRGIPKTGAYIDYNWFYYTGAPIGRTGVTSSAVSTRMFIGKNKGPTGQILTTLQQRIIATSCS